MGKLGGGRLVQQDAGNPPKLILAAADFAEYGEEPPPELLQAFRVEQWGFAALYSEPLPAGEIRRMTTALNVYRAHLSFLSGSHQAARWAESHPNELAIVQSVRELRKDYA